MGLVRYNSLLRHYKVFSCSPRIITMFCNYSALSTVYLTEKYNENICVVEDSFI